jgi:hypothetical protein
LDGTGRFIGHRRQSFLGHGGQTRRSSRK